MDIESLLGDQAEYLLEHKATGKTSYEQRFATLEAECEARLEQQYADLTGGVGALRLALSPARVGRVGKPSASAASSRPSLHASSPLPARCLRPSL